MAEVSRHQAGQRAKRQKATLRIMHIMLIAAGALAYMAMRAFLNRLSVIT